jgi:hypothetical protein
LLGAALGPIVVIGCASSFLSLSLQICHLFDSSWAASHESLGVFE